MEYGIVNDKKYIIKNINTKNIVEISHVDDITTPVKAVAKLNFKRSNQH